MRKVIVLSILIAVFAAFFASAHPDGLEWVAEKLGFIEKGVEQTSLMTDYSMPFIPTPKPGCEQGVLVWGCISQPGISTAIAGILGIFIVFGLFWTTAKILRSNF
ncbi:MAG: PDGLE domain-containing protein [Candidatus Margulisiibacteriota bacterium]